MKRVKWFGKKGKLSPRYVGPCRVLIHVRKVAYEIELPAELSAVYPVFHVSMLRKCIGDAVSKDHSENPDVQDSLSYDEVPVEILDYQIRRLSDPHFSMCWNGVTCHSRHQRVRFLNLSNMVLMGVIPRDIGNLTFLVSLDLGGNNFRGNLPQEMAHLRRLKFLDLSVNNFRGKVPYWFEFLHYLQFLNLGNNSFTGSIPSSFSNMSTLKTLNLNSNSIEGQIPKVIGRSSKP
ncbi:putative LRR receptor-like serine/threonine-protein kinase-like [Capsicum annuum]|nr:putative LRR receptor-like serine/threonine-protein kinase-like [Capsicum annuum]